ncbi:alpha/beta hydrolase [Polaromonas sp.]|uniref:alpha/beta hydrolase n=1 Tax=Polaromonas sp. TaxID=1869339 RepID=UPI0032636DF9
MKLDEAINHHLEKLAALGSNDERLLTIEGRRHRLKVGAIYLEASASQKPIRQVTSLDGEIPTGDGSVRSRHYYIGGTEPCFSMIYFHGGGWVAGDLGTHDQLLRHVVDIAGCEIFSVDYALSPESRQPTACQQGISVLNYVSERRQRRDPRIVLGGDSAGAHIAASIANQTHTNIDGMFLLYPVISPKFDTNSHRYMGGTSSLTTAAMRWFWEQYLGCKMPVDRLDTTNPLIDLTWQKWLHKPPPAVIVSAWHDPLFDDAPVYAAALKKAGGTVTLRQAMDMNHGFARFLGVSDAAYRHVRDAINDLKEVIAVHDACTENVPFPSERGRN